MIHLRPVITAKRNLARTTLERLPPSEYPHVYIFTPDQMLKMMNYLTEKGVKLEVEV